MEREKSLFLSAEVTSYHFSSGGSSAPVFGIKIFDISLLNLHFK